MQRTISPERGIDLQKINRATIIFRIFLNKNLSICVMNKKSRKLYFRINAISLPDMLGGVWAGE